MKLQMCGDLLAVHHSEAAMGEWHFEGSVNLSAQGQYLVGWGAATGLLHSLELMPDIWCYAFAAEVEQENYDEALHHDCP